jgi:hypothetical protein
MYEFLATYAQKEYSATNSTYELLSLVMHNSTLNTSALYFYPFPDKDIKFVEIYRESLKNNTGFLIVNLEFLNEAEFLDEPSFLEMLEQEDNGSLYEINKNYNEN